MMDDNQNKSAISGLEVMPKENTEESPKFGPDATMNSTTKVLVIGTDRTLFNSDSPANKRIAEYGSLVGELHIVVFSLKKLGFEARKIASNVWIYPTNSNSRFSYTSDAKKISKKLIYERKFVRGLSVITSQDPFETGLVGLRLKRKFKLPLLVQIHTDIFSPYFSKTSLLNRFRKMFIAPKVIRKADSFRVVSEQLKKKLSYYHSISPSVISVLPVFVDVASKSTDASLNVHQKFPNWNPIILVVSRLAKEKNVSGAFRVFAKILKKYNEAGMIVVGTGPEISNLESLAKRLGIHNNISFEGWQNDLTPYYRTSDIMLATSFFEGFGMSLLEAAAEGCPVVSSNAGIASELFSGESHSWVCEVGDIDCFVSSLDLLISNIPLRQVVSQEIKKSAQKFAITKEEYLAKYKDLFERHFVVR